MSLGIENLGGGLDNAQCAVVMGFQRAFDSVDHDILLDI